jgi:hypothetical protein
MALVARLQNASIAGSNFWGNVGEEKAGFDFGRPERKYNALSPISAPPQGLELSSLTFDSAGQPRPTYSRPYSQGKQYAVQPWYMNPEQANNPTAVQLRQGVESGAVKKSAPMTFQQIQKALNEYEEITPADVEALRYPAAQLGYDIQEITQPDSYFGILPRGKTIQKGTGKYKLVPKGQTSSVDDLANKWGF